MRLSLQGAVMRTMTLEFPARIAADPSLGPKSEWLCLTQGLTALP